MARFPTGAFQTWLESLKAQKWWREKYVPLQVPVSVLSKRRGYFQKVQPVKEQWHNGADLKVLIESVAT